MQTTGSRGTYTVASRGNNTRPSHRRNKTPLTRFFEGLIDNCACSSNPGYTVDDDDIDDLLYSYEPNDSLNPAIANNKPSSSLRSYNRRQNIRLHRDDASVLYRDTDKSIQYLIHQHQKNQNRAVYYSNDQETCNNFRSKDHHYPIVSSAPSSDATATTVLTGSSSRSVESTPCCNGNGTINLRNPSQGSSILFEKRSRSTGTTRYPEERNMA